MNERVPTTSSAHATHDLDRVAVLAARPADLDERDAGAARAQIASCTACADLLADLVLLQTTLPGSLTPTRPRDFTLTPADAARLHAGGWRRLLGFIGSARDSFTRPLAVGLTSLGLVGLLVASVPSFISGSGGAAALAPGGPAAATSEVAGEAAGAAPAASAAASGEPAAPPSASTATGAAVPAAQQPALAPAASSAAPAPGTSTYDRARAAASGEPERFAEDSGTVFSGGSSDELTTVGRDTTGVGGLLSLREDAGQSVLFVVAGVMLIAGLGLFLLRWTSRRLL